MIRTSTFDRLDKASLRTPKLQPRGVQKGQCCLQRSKQSLIARGCNLYSEGPDSPDSSTFFLLRPTSSLFQRTPVQSVVPRKNLLKPVPVVAGSKLGNWTAEDRKQPKNRLEPRRCVFMPLSEVTPAATAAANGQTSTVSPGPVSPNLRNPGHRFKLEPKKRARRNHDWANTNTGYLFHDQKPVVMAPIPSSICMPGLSP